MPYTREISRQYPCYIVVLLDQSWSMQETFEDKPERKKMDACADAINRLILNLIIQSTNEKAEEVYHYFDISVVGYGKLKKGTTNALDELFPQQSVVSIVDLSKRCKTGTKKIKVNNDGQVGEEDIDYEYWIEAEGVANTPMADAFTEAYRLIEQWIPKHRSSFPPIVLNITDGQPDDIPSVKGSASKLIQLGADDGNVLIFNAHISSESLDQNGTKIQPVLFPQSVDSLPDEYAQFLFDISSPIPDRLLEQGRVPRKSRGFIYNANESQMTIFLDVGTPSTNIGN